MDPEGHPIPQDITGFQFRLIGDMTVKQFAYLAGGAILAWFFYSIPLPTVFKIPLIGGCALLGIVLAFMPIHGRPADVMLMLFLKAIFKPNQFKYKKIEEVINAGEQKTENRNEQTLQKSNAQTTNVIARNSAAQNDEAIPTISSKPDEIASGRSIDLHNDVSISKSSAAPTNTAQVSQQPAPSPTPAPPQPHPLLPVLPADAINLIAGVVEDPRGNVLQNILVDVKDPAGSPVRAFKTNQMGQFIAATPLSNGTYAITFEDPDKRHQFPTLTITATGAPLTPIEVKSMDQREQLRQALFTTTTIPPIQKTS